MVFLRFNNHPQSPILPVQFYRFPLPRHPPGHLSRAGMRPLYRAAPCREEGRHQSFLLTHRLRRFVYVVLIAGNKVSRAAIKIVES